MARCRVESNDIFALVALKPSTNALIPSTIIGTLAQSKFAKSCKHPVKAAVCEASVAPVDWHTTRLSASFVLVVNAHNRFIMPRFKPCKPRT